MVGLATHARGLATHACTHARTHALHARVDTRPYLHAVSAFAYEDAEAPLNGMACVCDAVCVRVCVCVCLGSGVSLGGVSP